MTPQDWNKALAPAVPAKLAGESVAKAVRDLLDGDVRFLSTTELADILYPPQFARGDEGQAARHRLFECLRYLAKHDLQTYATKGEPRTRKMYGRTRVERPIIWHAPISRTEVKRCPHCGGVLTA